MTFKPFAQISTNVPSEMYQELRKEVTTKDTNMSQLVRTILAGYLLRKADNLPKPGWAADLNHNIEALRKEIIDAKQTRDGVLLQLIKQITELRKEVKEVKEISTTRAENFEPTGEELESELTKQLDELRKEMLVVQELTQVKLDQFQEQSLLAPVAYEQIGVKGRRWPVLLGRLSKVFGAKQKPAEREQEEYSEAS